MPKTVIFDVPDSFDFGKLVTALGSHVDGLRILKPDERAEVLTAAPRNSKIKRARGQNGVSVVQTIMDHFTMQGIFTSTHAQAWVHQNQFDLKSASPALTALKKSGHIAQIGQGQYKFLRPMAKGEDVRAAGNGRT